MIIGRRFGERWFVAGHIRASSLFRPFNSLIWNPVRLIVLMLLVSACYRMSGCDKAHSAELGGWQGAKAECLHKAETTFCVGKAGCPDWQWTVKCIAHSLPRPPQGWVTQACVSKEWTQRQTEHAYYAYDDPIGNVMRCAGAK